ncbi:MAG: hypothetical protein WKG07_25010 [Hymenobacter sp.]
MNACIRAVVRTATYHGIGGVRHHARLHGHDPRASS